MNIVIEEYNNEITKLFNPVLDVYNERESCRKVRFKSC